MSSFFQKSSLLILIPVLPLIIMSAIGLMLARAEIETQTLNGLEALASAQQGRIEQVVERYDAIHTGMTSRSQFRASLAEFNQAGGGDAHVSSINRILTDARAPFSDIEGFAVLAPNGATVVGSDTTIESEPEVAKRLFESGKDQQVISPVGAAGKRKLLYSGPIKRDGQLLGVLLITFKADVLTAALNERSGLGSTGETVLGYRNGDKITLLSTRFGGENQVLEVTSDNGRPMQMALQKQETTIDKALDYRGHEILAVTRYIDNADWGLVTKKDRAEVLQPVDTFTAIYLFILAVMIPVALSAGWWLFGVKAQRKS